MVGSEDDEDVIRFRTRFEKLRDWIDDNPVGLPKLAYDDAPLQALCFEVWESSNRISSKERRHRELFAGPVDPAFISAWRDFEERYRSAIFEITVVASLDLAPSNGHLAAKIENDRFDSEWRRAAEEAALDAAAVNAAINQADVEVCSVHESGSESNHSDYVEHLEEVKAGVTAWANLADQVGFDLEGVFRRRALVPFVNIPSHVANNQGKTDPLTLTTHLKQAQEAFVYGVPFAALALMRSILDVVLRRYYCESTFDKDDLKDIIDYARGLPSVANKQRLHRLRMLANNILHFNTDRVNLPREMEREILSFLLVLRALIEQAPKVHRRL